MNAVVGLSVLLLVSSCLLLLAENMDLRAKLSALRAYRIVWSAMRDQERNAMIVALRTWRPDAWDAINRDQSNDKAYVSSAAK